MADSLFKRAARTAVGVFTNAPKPEATWNLLGGVLPGGIGTPPTRYARDFLRSYSQLPWLHAVANKIAISIAQVEWRLYAKQSAGKATKDLSLIRGNKFSRTARIKSLRQTNDLREIEDHQILDVIHNANSVQTGLQMRKVTQLHLDLVGEAFWLKERDGAGTIVGVWPIPPDWILSTPTPSHPFYRVSYRSWQGYIPDTEFVWFQDTDPVNPYARGSGTAQSLGDELETDEYAAKHTKAFFYNRAKPDLLIYPKQGSIREPDIKRLETDWIQSNQGFWRAFKPYFMTREVGVHEMDQNFRAMQLVQLREYERDVILQTFGIPPELLGVLAHSNRSTIDAADYMMARYVLEPRLEFLRTVLQERFIPEYDDRIIIDYESPVGADRESETRAASMFPWALTIDEQRELAGKPQMDDKAVGELHMIPPTYILSTLEEAAKRAAGQAEQQAQMMAQQNAMGASPGNPGVPPPNNGADIRNGPPTPPKPSDGDPKEWPSQRPSQRRHAKHRYRRI